MLRIFKNSEESPSSFSLTLPIAVLSTKTLTPEVLFCITFRIQNFGTN